MGQSRPGLSFLGSFFFYQSLLLLDSLLPFFPLLLSLLFLLSSVKEGAVSPLSEKSLTNSRAQTLVAAVWPPATKWMGLVSETPSSFHAAPSPVFGFQI